MKFLRGWWLSMGPWRWLNALPIIVAITLSMVYEPMPSGWTDHGTVTVGGTEVRLASRGAIRAGERLALRLTVSEPAALELGFPERQRLAVGAEDFDETGQWQTRLTMPDTPNDVATLAVYNAEYAAGWVLGRLIL